MTSSNLSFPSLVLRASAALISVIAVGIAACGGGGGGSEATGTLRLSLTDAPACGYDNVWVTVERVRIHSSSTAGDTDGGWSEVVLATPQRVDLLTLTNGTLLPLGQTELQAGKYTQMRLVLGSTAPSSWPSGTLANSIQPTGGQEVALTTPSALQSGLKMNVDIDVAADTLADFAIDFDACKSFIKAGNSGQYILKPVLSVIPILSSKIVGWVDPAMAAAGVVTTVSAQVDGVPVRSTPPTADGRFELFPIRTGTYDLVITSAGRVNAVMTGVPVTSAGATTIGSTTVRLAPPASAASAVVSGTVSVAGSFAGTDGSVRAVQSLSVGTKMEVGQVNADATTGAYSLRLSTAAPASAAYAASASAFTFTSDSLATAGNYRIEATTPSVTTPLVFNLTLTGDTTVPSFVFP
jgi:hypothetical protein